MNPSDSSSHERARRFNESEAIQQDYKSRRFLRRLEPVFDVPEDILDALDWHAAVREHLQIRAIGTLFPLIPSP
jgi:hypothetical protein